MAIYLDNAGSTPVVPEVLAAVASAARNLYGNAAAVHRAGVDAAKTVESARQVLARALGAVPDEIVFTSGGTESNNLAIKGLALAAVGAGGRRRRRVVVSAIEHPSVLSAARWLGSRGFEVALARVGRDGVVAPGEVGRLLTRGTVLASVMHANNETGAIQPIAAIGRLCRRAGVPFHTDACQSFCKAPFDVRRACVDLATVNGHKMHGPKGVGALFVRKGLRLEPLLSGGGHEGGLRPGTPNTEGIAGFARAVELWRPGHATAMAALRARLLGLLKAAFPDLRENGPAGAGLCSILSVVLPGVDAKALVLELSRLGVFIATGSACSSGKSEPSRVLTAMGLSEEEAGSTIRLSLGRTTSAAEVARAVRLIAKAAGRRDGGR